MPNELQKKVTKRAAEITGQMFCTNCQLSRNKDGGLWRVTADGMRRRWTCGWCVNNYKNRTAPNASGAK